MEYIEPPPAPKPEKKKLKEKFLKVHLNDKDERKLSSRKLKLGT